MSHTIPSLKKQLSERYNMPVAEHHVRRALDIIEGRGVRVQHIGRLRVISARVAREIEHEMLDKGQLRRAETART